MSHELLLLAKHSNAFVMEGELSRGCIQDQSLEFGFRRDLELCPEEHNILPGVLDFSPSSGLMRQEERIETTVRC